MPLADLGSNPGLCMLHFHNDLSTMPPRDSTVPFRWLLRERVAHSTPLRCLPDFFPHVQTVMPTSNLECLQPTYNARCSANAGWRRCGGRRRAMRAPESTCPACGILCRGHPTTHCFDRHATGRGAGLPTAQVNGRCCRASCVLSPALMAHGLVA